MEIVKVYTEKLPARKFVGKKYGDSDRVNGGFGAKWGECFDNGWIDEIENAAISPIDADYPDGGAYIGLMRSRDGDPFEYRIGMFLPTDTPVPDGFDSTDFPAGTLGVGWVRGNDTSGEVYCHESDVAKLLGEAGHQIKNDEAGACWFFERYVCPRYTTPDENGDIILDVCFFVD